MCPPQLAPPAHTPPSPHPAPNRCRPACDRLVTHASCGCCSAGTTMPRCTHAAAYSRTQMQVLKQYPSRLWNITLATSTGLCWRGCQKALASLALQQLPCWPFCQHWQVSHCCAACNTGTSSHADVCCDAYGAGVSHRCTEDKRTRMKDGSCSCCSTLAVLWTLEGHVLTGKPVCQDVSLQYSEAVQGPLSSAKCTAVVQNLVLSVSPRQAAYCST